MNIILTSGSSSIDLEQIIAAIILPTEDPATMRGIKSYSYKALMTPM
jgi:hypothetical protein